MTTTTTMMVLLSRKIAKWHIFDQDMKSGSPRGVGPYWIIIEYFIIFERVTAINCVVSACFAASMIHYVCEMFCGQTEAKQTALSFRSFYEWNTEIINYIREGLMGVCLVSEKL